MVPHISSKLRTLQLAAPVLLIHLTTTLVNAQGPGSDDPPELLPTVTSSRSATSSPSTVAGPLDAPQVVELTRAGLDDGILADLLHERGVARPLSVEDLLFLRRNSVSNEVIRAMQQASPRAAVQAAPPTVVQAAPPTVVRVDPPPPPPVIIQTVPSYYWGYGPPIYRHPHYWHPYHGHPYRGHPHSRGAGRVSIGFSF